MISIELLPPAAGPRRLGVHGPYSCTVLEDQPDYDHLPQWKKSLIR